MHIINFLYDIFANFIMITKLPSRSVILAQTISAYSNASPSLFQTLNQYRHSLQSKQAAANRTKLLEWQIQKKKSHLQNQRKHRSDQEYYQQMAALDREILTLKGMQDQRSLTKLRQKNLKERHRGINNRKQASLSLEATHTSLYRQAERRRIQDQTDITIRNQKQQTKREIQALKARIELKKRKHRVLEYQQTKMSQLMSEKQKQAEQLERESIMERDRINRIVKRNTNLKVKKGKIQKCWNPQVGNQKALLSSGFTANSQSR